ncbi:MAG TPA: hypothetical protein VK919_03335 [Solirubrobacterales bacterium]|nr:hypothetical protein [Solirubrobacterales bacterium]
MAAEGHQRPRNDRSASGEEAASSVHGANARRRIDRDSPDLDALGLDKRRTVVGGSYSPSFARQAGIYGAFLAVVAVLVVGAILAVGALDKPRERETATAPWAQPASEQLSPRPLDFPRNGRTEVD